MKTETGYNTYDVSQMTEEEKDLMSTVMCDPYPELTQSIGRIAVATLKHIHGFDIDGYSVMELTAVIDAMKAARKAKLQRHLGQTG